MSKLSVHLIRVISAHKCRLKLIPEFSLNVYRNFELKQLTSKTPKKSTLKEILNSLRKATGFTLLPWFSIPKVPSECP